MSRTNKDWSKHTHKREVFKNSEGKEITVDHFQEGDKSAYYIVFINDFRGLTVRGDLGNWIFCRNFHPDSDTESIDDGYWCEKLSIGSIQEPYSFDLELNLKALNDYVEILQKEGDLDHEEEEELIYWRDEVMSACDRYDYYAAVLDAVPSCVDYEAIPDKKVMNARLKYVFDAFEEICRRMEIQDRAVEIMENVIKEELKTLEE